MHPRGGVGRGRRQLSSGTALAPDRAVGATYNNMANVYNRMEDYEAALECQQKALAIQVNTLGESHRDVGIGRPRGLLGRGRIPAGSVFGI